MNLTWIDTAGGPLVGASYVVGLNWRGAQASSTGETQSDYDRACGVTDYVGVISCASSRVLVFGDEPLRTAILRNCQGIAIVRWVYCESEDHAQAELAALPRELPQLEMPKSIPIDSNRLILFDSAFLLDLAPHRLEAVLPSGLYEVSTEKFSKLGVFEFLIHRLVRAAELSP